jgi:hypothetical protein
MYSSSTFSSLSVLLVIDVLTSPIFCSLLKQLLLIEVLYNSAGRLDVAVCSWRLFCSAKYR